MAVNKTLADFLGVGASQTETQVTFDKGALISARTPPAFAPLIATTTNTAESIFVAMLMRAWEFQDTSNDAEVAIFGPSVSLVEIVSDGVSTPFEQYVFTVRVLNKKSQAMPNPNLI